MKNKKDFCRSMEQLMEYHDLSGVVLIGFNKNDPKVQFADGIGLISSLRAVSCVVNMILDKAESAEDIKEQLKEMAEELVRSNEDKN